MIDRVKLCNRWHYHVDGPGIKGCFGIKQLLEHATNGINAHTLQNRINQLVNGKGNFTDMYDVLTRNVSSRVHGRWPEKAINDEFLWIMKLWPIGSLADTVR